MGDRTYEDAEHCIVITGSLTIQASSATDLSRLHTLEEVGGDVTIRDNANLTSVDIPKLREIGGEFYYLSNFEVTRIHLDQINHVGDRFWISAAKVTSLSVPNLITVGTDLNISGLRSTIIEFESLDARAICLDHGVAQLVGPPHRQTRSQNERRP